MERRYVSSMYIIYWKIIFMESHWQIMRYPFCIVVQHSHQQNMPLSTLSSVGQWFLAFFLESKLFFGNSTTLLSSTFCNTLVIKDLAPGWALTTMSSSKCQGSISSVLKTWCKLASLPSSAPLSFISDLLHRHTHAQ